MTATSSNDGEFETSTTTCAPLSTSANPSPVSVLTPVLGAAATASCPSALSLVTSFDPIRPVPPITTIFILLPPSFFAADSSSTAFVSAPAKRLHKMLICDVNFSFTIFRSNSENSCHKSTHTAEQGQS